MQDEHDHDDVSFEVEESEANPKDLIKKLRASLKEAQQKNQELLDGWQRAKADFVNSKKQEEENRKQFVQFAEERLINRLLPVLESFDMAMSNRATWEQVPKDWRVGVEYIHSQLLKSLEESGLKPIGEVGILFDPKIHSAVENVPVTDEKQDHTVMEVVQKGYELLGKVLRPARVKVGVYEATH
jgi:molecular chaperone GrpE